MFSAAGLRLNALEIEPLSIARLFAGDPTPTTIVDLSGGGNSWMILREGAIPTHEIALALQH